MAVPAITLTDPNDRDAAPSPALSPTKEPIFADLSASKVAGRPASPVSRNSSARPESSNGWSSPGRLLRAKSSNGSASNSTQTGDVNGSGAIPPTMDPLSKHILKRTNTPMALTQLPTRPRTSDGGSSHKDDRPSMEQTTAPAVQDPLPRTDTASTAHKDLKRGVKAVSFLSKLMGAKKRDVEVESAIDDDDESASEERPEGNDAQVFAQSVDNMGFHPRHPQPPAYIKVRSKHKKEKNFDRLFLAQELRCCENPPLSRKDSSNKLRRKSSATPNSDSTVCAMEFSKDGKYLAAAGADMVIRVWAVLASPEDRQKHETQESNENETNGTGSQPEHLSAPVFQGKPVREYRGHTSTVLDLSWSKNNFLLSSSMDKTVRLWHASRAECLCTFKHNDIVPSIAFHPKDDRFFLAGSLDSRLRLWSIPDKSVAYTVQVPDMITAVAFTPDGKCSMAGCLAGLCMFYETEGLKYQTQIHVRSTRGQNARGSKITGIQAQYSDTGDAKVLITSNDSRTRLYNFRDKSLELKFKGHENAYSQIRATLSDDGRYVICGSEDRKAYIWSLAHPHGEKRDKIPLEVFDAHDTVTTVACMAPAKTRHHLSRSDDPVYDLCNPPPVTLLSHAERAGSQSSSRAPTESGSIQVTPVEAEGRFVDKARESPTYLSRATHKEGSIVVTADFTGKIKVFRQDCAWSKRKQAEWDRTSLFTKRGSRTSRTGSMATRASQRSIPEVRGRNSTSTQAPSDRILSWRQGITSASSIIDGVTRSAKHHNSRSISPRKSLDRRSKADTKASESPSTPKSIHPLASDVMVRSPSPIHRDPPDATAAEDEHRSGSPHDRRDSNPLNLQGNHSYVFWDPKQWEGRMVSKQQHLAATPPSGGDDSPGGPGNDDPTHLAVRPPLHTAPTCVSRLSDERSSGEDEAFDDAREHGEDMACFTCGGSSFSARRTKDGMKLACVQCGALC